MKQPNMPTATSTIKAYWIAAALLGLLMLVLGYFYQRSSQLDNAVHQYIQQQLSNDAPALRALVAAAQPQNTIAAELQKMDDQLHAGQPLQALAIGHHILEQDPGNSAVWLRLGIVYLQQRQYEEAQHYLQAVHQDPSTTIAPIAAWYLALLHAQHGDYDRCRTLLQEVAASTYYTHEADELMALL